MEELQCKTVFTIPVFGGIPVAESVAVTWVIMAVLLILSLVLVRNLSVENPGKKQVVIRPTSLCMRLFGNVLGSYVVMKLLEFICPAVLPIPFSLYFDFFDGFIQAYVFVFLTSLFIKEAIE